MVWNGVDGGNGVGGMRSVDGGCGPNDVDGVESGRWRRRLCGEWGEGVLVAR